MNKINKQLHTCFCCSFIFNSTYGGQGDKFCATCRNKLTEIHEEVWKETDDKTFQSKGQFKHKIFKWKKRELYIVVGPQKIKAPNIDSIFCHFVKKVYKYRCCSQERCNRNFFSYDEYLKCPYCESSYLSVDMRFMICSDSEGTISDSIPEMKVLPVIEIIENWAWKYDYPETYFLPEVILLYMAFTKKTNAILINNFLKKQILPNIVSSNNLKSEYNNEKEDSIPMVIDEQFYSVLNRNDSFSAFVLKNDNEIETSLKRNQSSTTLSESDYPHSSKKKISVTPDNISDGDIPHI